jgi:hypothetical protein
MWNSAGQAAKRAIFAAGLAGSSQPEAAVCRVSGSEKDRDGK